MPGLGTAFSSPSRFEMLRFLKKHRKPSKKAAPSDHHTHEINDFDTKRGCDPGGEYRLRKISELIADTTNSTITLGINHGGCSQIATRDGRIEDQRLPTPNTSTLTPGHDGGGLAGESGRL